MKITKEIIQRIEGEATLELEWEEEKIYFARIKFFNFRGIEDILKGKPLHDAIAITPRVCGICSTAHSLAATLAIESCYANFGEPLHVSQKAKDIREITLNAEKIQNHIKWYYFSILPELQKLENPTLPPHTFKDKVWFDAQKAIIESLKLGAIFSGQWPHGSFLMSGGVTCDPLNSDVVGAQNCLNTVIAFCETHLYGMEIEEFLSLDCALQIMANNASLCQGVESMMQNGFDSFGRSYDRFLALGESFLYENPSKCFKTNIVFADIRHVSESLENSFFDKGGEGYTYSKSALYKKNYCEVGPLARLMISKDLLIRDMHRRFKDSTLTRVVARVAECAHLLRRTQHLLASLNIKEVSYVKPKSSMYNFTCEGIGVVEASRGSLIHKIEVENGLIKEYDIITPTVWNLGNGTLENSSIAQKAILGLPSIEKADFVFKSFDVCSVCTTQ